MAKDKTGVKARVLVDGAYGKVNDVITLPEDEVEAAAGQVDTNEKSVAYAEAEARKKAAVNE